MDNPEEVLHCLDEFAKLKPKDIPRELEDYLVYVARTGDPVYQWPVVKCLFREKLLNVITEFYETTPSCDIPQCPNVDPFNYETMKSVLLERLEAFSNAPFTVQRLCELLTTPRKEYNRPDKFMRAIEKNILVVSTREPGGACRPDSALSEPLPNGVSDSAEPTSHPESHTNTLKENLGNHVSSVSSDESSSTSSEASNHVDTEQSESSSNDKEADEEDKVKVKKEEANEEPVNQTDSAVSNTEAALTVKSETKVETASIDSQVSITPSVESSDSVSVTVSEKNDVGTSLLSPTESTPSVEDVQKVSEETPAPSEETCAPSSLDENAENVPTHSPAASNEDETKPLDSEAQPSTSKTETPPEPSTGPETVEEPDLVEPAVTEEPKKPQSGADLKSQADKVKESEPVPAEAASPVESLELTVDTPCAGLDQEKSKEGRVSVGEVESISKTLNNENTEESVHIETTLGVSEESISIDQAQEEAMDVDESSNQLADSEAMAVAEESEPMDDSEQSPTEEMTVCPQLPSQD